MVQKFFQDWALWEKMTFILACCIVSTIFAGFCKLTYSNWQLRKYDQIATARALQTLQLLEAQTLSEEELKAEEKGDIPFGIRAIESGIQIDGVWVSRGNTPAESVASSFDESRETTHFRSGFDPTQLEIPGRVYGRSSRSSLLASSSAFERAVSAERLRSSGSDSSSSTRSTRSIPNAPRSREGSRNSSLMKKSSTLLALEDLGFRRTPSLMEHIWSGTSTSSDTSAHGSDETDYVAISIPQLPVECPYESAYLKPIIAPVIAVDSKWNLDLLQSHRLSHVAETGQLTPRIRRPGFSGDWASFVVGPKPNMPMQSTLEPFTPHRKSSSLPPVELDLSPVPPRHSHVSSSGTGNHLFDSSSRTISRPNTYRPPGVQSESRDKEPSSDPVNPTIASQAHRTQHVQPVYHTQGLSVAAEKSENQLRSPTTQKQRGFQVLRKVNSGFVILRPGTLSFANQQPVDAEGSTASEKRHSRRLIKKRRGSDDFRAST